MQESDIDFYDVHVPSVEEVMALFNQYIPADVDSPVKTGIYFAVQQANVLKAKNKELTEREEKIDAFNESLKPLVQAVKSGDAERIARDLGELLIKLNMLSADFKLPSDETGPGEDSAGNPHMSVDPVGAEQPHFAHGTETPCSTTSTGAHVNSINQIGDEINKACNNISEDEKTSAAKTIQKAAQAAASLANSCNRAPRRLRNKPAQYSEEQSQDPEINRAKVAERKPQTPSRRQKAREDAGVKSVKSSILSVDLDAVMFSAFCQNRGMTDDQIFDLYALYKKETNNSSLAVCSCKDKDNGTVCNGELIELKFQNKSGAEHMIMDVMAFIDRYVPVQQQGAVLACTSCGHFFPDMGKGDDCSVYPGAPLSSSLFASMVVDNRNNNLAINKLTAAVKETVSVSRSNVAEVYVKAKNLYMIILSSVIEAVAAHQGIIHIDESHARCLIKEEAFKKCAAIEKEHSDDPSFSVPSGKRGYVLVTSTPYGAVIKVTVYSASFGRGNDTLGQSLWYLLPKDLDDALKEHLPDEVTLIADGYKFYSYLQELLGFDVQRCMVHVRRELIRAGNPRDYVERLNKMSSEERTADYITRIKAGNGQLVINAMLYMVNTWLATGAESDRLIVERNKLSALAESEEVKAEKARLYKEAAELRSQMKSLAYIVKEAAEILSDHYEQRADGTYAATRKNALSKALAYIMNACISDMPALDNPEIPLHNNEVERQMRIISSHRKTIMKHVSVQGFSSDMCATTVLKTLQQNGHTDLVGKLQELVSMICYNLKELTIAKGIREGHLTFNASEGASISDNFNYGKYLDWLSLAADLPLADYLEHIFDTVACVSLDYIKDDVAMTAGRIIREKVRFLHDDEFRTEDRHNLTNHAMTMDKVARCLEAASQEDDSQCHNGTVNARTAELASEAKSYYDRCKYNHSMMSHHWRAIHPELNNEFAYVQEFQGKFLKAIYGSDEKHCPKDHSEWNLGSESSKSYARMLELMLKLEKNLNDSDKIPKPEYCVARLMHFKQELDRFRMARSALAREIRLERMNADQEQRKQNLLTLYRIYLTFARQAKLLETELIQAYQNMFHAATSRTLEARRAYESVKCFLKSEQKKRLAQSA